NNFSKCMEVDGEPMTGAMYYATYRRDITALVAEAADRQVPVLIVGPPAFPPDENRPDRVKLNAVFAKIAADHPGAYYAASVPQLSPHGFVWELPCLPG